MRARVSAAVGARLRASGIELDGGDLDAAYALAWQGLYAALLEEEPIESPVAWLTLVAYRRAVEEHRSRSRLRGAGEVDGVADAEADICEEVDLAGELDGRIRLGNLLEGLSGRLDDRERQAATLCYLQGLSRAEAAVQMGISEGRMRKLMEGRGAGDPGVAGKVGELARVIDEGKWCDSQGSLMRALAYGILDRDGERYRVALSHHRRCPSCRAYVVSLRGIAVALPPALLPGARLALAAIAGGGSGASGAAALSGAGGGGLAFLGGPLGAKLAIGCLVAVGVGAGCVGLEVTHPLARAPSHPRTARALRAGTAGPPAPRTGATVFRGHPAVGPRGQGPSVGRPVAALREFGLEPPRSPRTSGESSPGVASKPRRGAFGVQRSVPTATAAAVPVSAAAHAAAREFGPG